MLGPALPLVEVVLNAGRVVDSHSIGGNDRLSAPGADVLAHWNTVITIVARAPAATTDMHSAAIRTL